MKKKQNRKPPIKWDVTVRLWSGAKETKEYVAHTAHAAMRRSEIPLKVHYAISATPVIPRTTPTPLGAL